MAKIIEYGEVRTNPATKAIIDELFDALGETINTGFQRLLETNVDRQAAISVIDDLVGRGWADGFEINEEEEEDEG